MTQFTPFQNPGKSDASSTKITRSNNYNVENKQTLKE